jgi:hypothetical protein
MCNLWTAAEQATDPAERKRLMIQHHELMQAAEILADMEGLDLSAPD